MKRFTMKGIFFSLTFALMVAGVLSDPGPGQPCTGATALVGNIVCDANGPCQNVYEDAVSCVCKPGYLGDGWVIGKGCSQDGADSRKKREADAKFYPGMWSPIGGNKKTEKAKLPVGLIPCFGPLQIVGKLLCAPNALCHGIIYPLLTFKCICPAGKVGNPYKIVGHGAVASSGCH